MDYPKIKPELFLDFIWMIPGFFLDFSGIMSGLTVALSCYLKLSLSSIKAGESKLFLFETF